MPTKQSTSDSKQPDGANVNEHVAEYLDFYLASTSAPNYAVMIDGEWGCGKTFFIKKYRETYLAKHTKASFVYISLYGIAQSTEIDDQIFQQLHPYLASKPVAIAAKALKGAVKAGLKLDLFGEQGSIDVGTPDVKISDFLGKGKDAVFIFDDLERCLMPIDRILGYINYFVEHQNHRAIILANEAEISNRSRHDQSKYLSIKEKLIGRTFKVFASVDSALDAFIEGLDEGAARQVVIRNKNLIRATYSSAAYNNLRSLRQALNEFYKLHGLLPTKAQAHDELVSKMLQTLLILTLEIRKGTLSIDDINGIGRRTISAIATAAINKKKKAEEIDPVVAIERKYTSFQFSALCPSDECWHSYFKHGSIDRIQLEESIDKSAYFVHESIPSWVKLWHFFDLQQDEFSEMLKSVRTDFDASLFTEPGLIRHVVGMFLFFGKAGMSGMSLPTTKRWLVRRIGELKSSGSIKRSSPKLMRFNDAYAGLGYIGMDIKEFGEISRILDDIDRELQAAEYPKLAAEVLSYMKTNPHGLWEKTSYHFSGNQEVSEAPIFGLIDVAEFCDAYLACPNANKKYVDYTLKDRYERARIYKELAGELNWIKSVRKELRRRMPSLGSLDRHISAEFILRSIDPSIKILESLHPRTKGRNSQSNA